MAAGRADEQDLAKMEECLSFMEQAEEMDEQYYRSDLAFHLAMVEASKNVVLAAIIRSFEPLLKDVIVASSQQEVCIERRYGYHRAIFEGISNRDEKAAADAVKRHLKATYSFVKQSHKG